MAKKGGIFNALNTQNPGFRDYVAEQYGGNPVTQLVENLGVPDYNPESVLFKQAPYKQGTPAAEPSIYDQMLKMSMGLAGFEAGMSLIGAAQSVFAKPTTVTRPKNISLTPPKIESNIEATRSVQKEVVGTAINTVLERGRETGTDIKKLAPGILEKTGEFYRKSSAELGNRRQDLLNQRNIAVADIKNKEILANAEIDNAFIARKDEALGRDSFMRGQQFSQSISNLGGIFGRLMNEKMMVSILRNENLKGEGYMKFAYMQSLGLA